MSPQVWLITGASSGFGLCMTRHVLSKGDIAVATLRQPSALDSLKAQYPESQLLILKLDVTIPYDITAAFASAKERFGRVDVVFNNAGLGVVGETEATPENVARDLFDVNFWGADRINREAVRFFREENEPRKGGRIIVNSSYVGIGTIPGIAYYSAAKHALEGVTKCLKAELDPEWNIKITLVEAGFFNTNLGRDKVILHPVHPAYESLAKTTKDREYLASVILNGDSAEKGVAKMYDLSLLENPPLHLPLGKDVLVGFKAFAEELTEVVHTYPTWSDNLGNDFDST
ncbi:hypothetical protein C8Q75DRAFT_147703 [Abortiporus biennis]|nr:hypothetical protein C8Q75DRAFT_147703 [Abortiporus biennis]